MRENQYECRVVILGARGSVPVSGREFQEYGGATSCVLFQLADFTALLDAGTGIMSLPAYLQDSQPAKLHLFLSHYHLDHVIGLPMCPTFFAPDTELWIYSPGFLSPPEESLEKLFGEPYWPVHIGQLPCKSSFCVLTEKSRLLSDGLVRVRMLRLEHPGGVCAYRLDWEKGSIVYATDCELAGNGIETLAEFAKDARLLILDAQYTSEEYERYQGFGHSTQGMALRLMKPGNIERCLLFHHAPGRTDLQLEQMDQEIHQQDSRISYARERMSIEL